MYEVSSEASFDKARIREFDASKADLTFSETILTFNYTPSEEEKLIYQLEDESWVTSYGHPGKFFTS